MCLIPVADKHIIFTASRQGRQKIRKIAVYDFLILFTGKFERSENFMCPGWELNPHDLNGQ